MFELTAGYLIVPQLLYNVLLIGSGGFSVIALTALLFGFLKGSHKTLLLWWAAVFLVAFIFLFFTGTGVIVGRAMLG